MTDIDPKLQIKLEQAGDKGIVEAVLLLSDEVAEAFRKGGSNNLIKLVSTQLHEKPRKVKYLPNLGVLTVRASGMFIQQLLKEPGVTVATVPEAEITKA